MLLVTRLVALLCPRGALKLLLLVGRSLHRRWCTRPEVRLRPCLLRKLVERIWRRLRRLHWWLGERWPAEFLRGGGGQSQDGRRQEGKFGWRVVGIT